ncbi:MAG: hypothetical protein AAF465_13455 [Pseudomonadota bacterium]
MFKLIIKLHVAMLVVLVGALLISKLPGFDADLTEFVTYTLIGLGLIVVGLVAKRLLGAYFRSAGGPRYSDTNLRGGDYRDAEQYYE